MRRIAVVLSPALLSSDFCSDETDNSPPLQLHTLKEFEQVRTFILNAIQFNMTYNTNFWYSHSKVFYSAL